MRGRGVALLVLVLLVAVALPFVVPSYGLRVLDLALISAVAVLGLVFAFGYSGLAHLGQAAFVGIGAYTTALLSTGLGVGVWLTLPAAMLVGAFAALLVGAPLLRLSGHYLALATVGFNEAIVIVARNWTAVTGGEDGISGIPSLSIGPWQFGTDRSFYYLALAVVVLAAAVAAWVRFSRLGRQMIAVRDDELACAACGVGVVRTKRIAFVLASVYGAVSGALYAQYVNYIAPTDFDVVRSITLLVMLIVGGEASITGAIAGCIVISFAPEALRFVGEAYLTVFGIAVIAVLVLLPQGMTGVLDRFARARLARSG